jgi:plastocyanin
MLRALLLVLVPLLLAGCAGGTGGTASADHGDHGGHEGRAAVEGAREVALVARDLRFEPDAIEVEAGEDVAIVLTAEDVEHDFVVDEADVHVGAEAGETATGGLRIDEPGTYTAYCSVAGHRSAGMEATVTVTAAAG